MFICNEELNSVSENLKCSVCTEYMHPSALLFGCGHTYCERCITELQQMPGVNKHCPKCRHPDLSWVKNFCLEETICCLKGKCGRARCNFTGTFQAYKNHLCAFEPIQCSNINCELTCERQHMPQHTATCPFEVIICECGQPTVRNSMDLHQSKVCTMRLIKCGNCQQEFKWDKLVLHKFSCNERMMTCIVPGCQQRVMFRDLKRHDIECMARHLSLWQNLLLRPDQIYKVLDEHRYTLEKFVWNEARCNTSSPRFTVQGAEWQIALVHTKVYLHLTDSQAATYLNVGVVVNGKCGKTFNRKAWNLNQGPCFVNFQRQDFRNDINILTLFFSI